jgi:hypothetical protein
MWYLMVLCGSSNSIQDCFPRIRSRRPTGRFIRGACIHQLRSLFLHTFPLSPTFPEKRGWEGGKVSEGTFPISGGYVIPPRGRSLDGETEVGLRKSILAGGKINLSAPPNRSLNPRARRSRPATSSPRGRPPSRQCRAAAPRHIQMK